MNISHSATVENKEKAVSFLRVGGWDSLSSSRRRSSMKMMTLMVVAMKFSPYS
jgi:hypothetical protein